MRKASSRMIIYTKDVMILTGKSERTSRRLLTRIRHYYGKSRRSLVTVEEFCTFTGFEAAHVTEALW